MASSSPDGAIGKSAFLSGVFLISFAMLIFQIVQTRILSVIAWYYLAFFAISVAMLGMTVGAVRVYLRREQFQSERLAQGLSDNALACALSMPASLLVQLSLITTVTLSLSTLVAWGLLLAAMAVPYVFAGIALSLALTRSPFPVSQVYAVDLLGAALGCVAVVVVLDFVDAPSTIVLAGAVAGVSSLCFASAARPRSRLRRPLLVTAALLVFTLLNLTSSVRIQPVLVKDRFERPELTGFERWNSYSRVVAAKPTIDPPTLWSFSPKLPSELTVASVRMSIDGAAGTQMFHYDGTRGSIEFLRYDLVNLAYNLPGIRKAAIIGVGGGRDVLAAHLFGVSEIVGVELNPIFIDLHTREPYKSFSNLTKLPNVRFVVDDARSWFASTPQKFDLIQMSMIDTWAATGAGAFTLSENGLYTLEGWRAFLRTLNPDGVLTVSRWYNPGDIDEAGRMVALATAAVLDMGAPDARPHIFVARAQNLATLVLSKQAFSASRLSVLNAEVQRLGFAVLLAPDHPAESDLIARMLRSKNISTLDEVAGGAVLDLSVPTDDRPFFFNLLRLRNIPEAARRSLAGDSRSGVVEGNLRASIALAMILVISLAAVIGTVLVPLRGVLRSRSAPLIALGSAYFSLIGMGFMLAEIALLQYFSVYLGHPTYSLAVCLFSLILATGIGSLASDRFTIASPRAMAIWGLCTVGYLLGLQAWLADVFQATAGRELSGRILVSLGVVVPLGFLLGFAFPTGMKLVEAVDPEPTPWFWGINGATGVLASVLAVMLSMSFGIRFTLLCAAACYLCLIPTSRVLIALGATQSQPQQ
jgi:hypothetical protein